MKAGNPKRRWPAISVFAVLAILATLTCISGPFRYFSICDRCGELRLTSDWQLPLIELTVFSRSIESQTPLSRVLLTNNIVRPHPHHWLFGQGGGRGVSCAIGPGRHIRQASDSKEVAGLVFNLHTHGLTAIRDRVVRGILDPDTSHLFRGLSFSVPKEPRTAAELQSWFAEELEFLESNSDEYKKR